MIFDLVAEEFHSVEYSMEFQSIMASTNQILWDYMDYSIISMKVQENLMSFELAIIIHITWRYLIWRLKSSMEFSRVFHGIQWIPIQFNSIQNMFIVRCTASIQNTISYHNQG